MIMNASEKFIIYLNIENELRKRKQVRVDELKCQF